MQAFEILKRHREVVTINLRGMVLDDAARKIFDLLPM
jgi:hypothetical protein